MKKYSLMFLWLYSINLSANVITPYRSDSLNNPHIKNICRQARSNHQSDIQQVNELYNELKILTTQKNILDKAEKIHSLITQINETSKRIRYLSMPEWNTETIPIELIWTVEHQLFYDETDFLNIKQTVLLADRQDFGLPYGMARNLICGSYVSPLNSFIFDRTKPPHPDLGKYLVLTNTRSSITGKKIIKSFFLNSENEDVRRYLALSPKMVCSEYEIDMSFYIAYKKNVTLLEACQMLDTLLFQVEVTYVVYERDPLNKDKNIRIEKKETIFLTAKNKDDNAS